MMTLLALEETTIEQATEQVVDVIAQTQSLPLVIGLTIFMLAVFLGIELISKIPPTLHTPLMSGSNAISGITLVGAILVAGNGAGGLAAFLGFLAVVMATVNVVGGFLVTHRMLQKFKR
ncbi:NAD(P) transhydrogenase subunit alpha [Thalassoglobus polymorphus]|uniref:proton-translocating NAD(P)(+) transhydrogenase n=2 Tax=Thalassoglobus polymorphus TaxID=2527994 RepID=A0A517QUW9_9PLAN|nr:NAD(P) transhydrogenase subunit alpha [Thalassoglobus polymorphus]QDT35410.1 NAD(P) transhydrogenase subunit alpha [Thalassoglobus polymorphus]